MLGGWSSKVMVRFSALLCVHITRTVPCRAVPYRAAWLSQRGQHGTARYGTARVHTSCVSCRAVPCRARTVLTRPCERSISKLQYLDNRNTNKHEVRHIYIFCLRNAQRRIMFLLTLLLTFLLHSCDYKFFVFFKLLSYKFSFH